MGEGARVPRMPGLGVFWGLIFSLSIFVSFVTKLTFGVIWSRLSIVI